MNSGLGPPRALVTRPCTIVTLYAPSRISLSLSLLIPRTQHAAAGIIQKRSRARAEKRNVEAKEKAGAAAKIQSIQRRKNGACAGRARRWSCD